MEFKSNEELVEYLKSLSNRSLKEFNLKITPTKTQMLGVKIPELRKIAKSAAKCDLDGFLSILGTKYFEETMLFGLAIGYADVTLEKRAELFDLFVPKADNWAHIDCSVATYKFIQKAREAYLPIVEKYLAENTEFGVRFALIILLDYYVTDEYLDYIFKVADNVDCSPYYVSMAVAWLLSVCYVKFPEETENYLKRTKTDDLTLARTIRKICDSYRVDKLSKNRIKKIKG